MKKYSSLLNPQYYFTDSVNEIPDFLYEKINVALNLDWHNEILICSCWIETILSKGGVFLLVTNKRVVFKSANKLTQTLFQDITSVETNLVGNIIIANTGKKYKLFDSSTLPTKKLLDILFQRINSQWINVKTNSSNTFFSATTSNKDINEKVSAAVVDNKKSTSWWQKRSLVEKGAILCWVFIFILFLFFRNKQKESIPQNEEIVNQVQKQIPDNTNAEQIKYNLSKSPFYYKYWKLSIFNDSNYTYRGFKSEALSTIDDDKIILQFDPRTNEIYYVGLYKTTNKMEVKPITFQP